MVYGLIAAAGWGASAIAATNAARRTGTYIAVLSSQGTGVVVLVLLAVFLHPPLGAISAPAALGLVGAGLLGLAGYLTFYRALEYGGAVGMVSAISATYGGITTLLAVIVLGEHLSGFGVAGVVLAVVGVALASARSSGTTEAPQIAVAEPIVGIAPGPSPTRSLSRAGVPLALASALTYGIGAFLLGDYSAKEGALGSALVAHGHVRHDLGHRRRPDRCCRAARVLSRRPVGPGGTDCGRVQRLSRHSAGRRAGHVRRAAGPTATARGHLDHRWARGDRPRVNM